MPRSVTLHPIAWPSRSLKFDTLFLARRRIAFWPVIIASSSIARSRSFGFVVASPSPIFTTTFSSFGIWLTFPYPNSSWSFGAIVSS